MSPLPDAEVRTTQPEDVPGIIALCRQVYPSSPPWSEAQLLSHLEVFAEGQFVAVVPGGGVVGMAASLIVRWDDYDNAESWRGFTGAGTFKNHDPQSGRTLYGAEVMVAPDTQGMGVGGRLYEARRKLARQLKLKRIRAGARLRGYHRYAEELTAENYTREVVAGRIEDLTLSFQLHQGFEVFDVVSNYLRNDPESLGYAALIEWLNPDLVDPTKVEGKRRLNGV